MASIIPKALDVNLPNSPDTTEAPPPTAVDDVCPIDNSDIGINETDKMHQLEKLLAHRPEKAELLEKNVLKFGKLDPSIQAKQLELAKNQLEDKLNAALAHRPEPQKLVEEGIMTEEEGAALGADQNPTNP